MSYFVTPQPGPNAAQRARLFVHNNGPAIGAGIASLGSQLLGSVFNAWQAKKDRDFQERMSNTAYQRSVADMEKAGINPALMYGQGQAPASTPGGSSATAAAPSLSMSELLESKRLQSEIDLNEASAERERAEAGLGQKQLQWYDKRTESELGQMRANIQSADARAALDRANIPVAEAEQLLTFENAVAAFIDNQTREKMNSLRMQLLQAQAAHDYASVEHLHSEIQLNEQRMLESAANANALDAQTMNFLEQNGVLHYEKELKAWQVAHLPADRIWDKAHEVVSIAGEALGTASGVMLGLGAGRLASAGNVAGRIATGNRGRVPYNPKATNITPPRKINAHGPRVRR